MPQANQMLYNQISKLPLEKIGKAMSFIRFLEQEQEIELLIDSVEENQLHEIIKLGEFVDSSELRTKIEAMPND